MKLVSRVHNYAGSLKVSMYFTYLHLNVFMWTVVLRPIVYLQKQVGAYQFYIHDHSFKQVFLVFLKSLYTFQLYNDTWCTYLNWKYVVICNYKTIYFHVEYKTVALLFCLMVTTFSKYQKFKSRFSSRNNKTMFILVDFFFGLLLLLTELSQWSHLAETVTV